MPSVPYQSLLPYLMAHGSGAPTGGPFQSLRNKGRTMGFDPLAPVPDANMMENPSDPMTGAIPGRGPLARAGTRNAPMLNDPAMSFQGMQFEPPSPTLGDLPQLDPNKLPPAGGKGVKTLGMFAGILGDALSAYGGQRGAFAPAMQQQMQNEDERNWARERLAAELDAKRQERMSPRVEQVGNTIGYLDPSQGQYKPFFTAPSPAEQYATARGFTAGTPEYQGEVENYRLGTWSDPAMENRGELDTQRFGQRSELQSDRLAVTRRGQDLTDARGRRGQTLTDNRSRRGQDMTDSRVRSSTGFQGRPQRGGGGAEPRAVSADGHEIVVRNGKWVDAKTGKPVQ